MDTYEELIADLIEKIGFDKGVEIERDLEITIDAIPLSLTFERIQEVEQLAISARIGRVSKARETQTYRLLLEANLNWSATRFATFGVNSATLDILMGYRCGIDALDGESLAALLSAFAAVAADWRSILESDEQAGRQEADIDMLMAIRA